MSKYQQQAEPELPDLMLLATQAKHIRECPGCGSTTCCGQCQEDPDPYDVDPDIGDR